MSSLQPHWQNDRVTLHCGDALETLKQLPDESAHCCVTSPPYFGLRDYGVEGQIGLEQTPDEYIAKMVEVFQEVRRVLRSDGTCWINIGDSYANDSKWGGSSGGKHVSALHGDSGIGRRKRLTGLKSKDLIGIPWMLAFALRSDGWYLRQDLVWSKPNPMPESVRDRCTKSHEYIFLLSKSARYFYDTDAIKEPSVTNDLRRPYGSPGANQLDKRGRQGNGQLRTAAQSFKRENSKRAQVIPGQSVGTHRPDRLESDYDLNTRNRRSVWQVATKPFKGAHFAVFPPELIEPCVLAGCPAGGTVLDPFAGSGTTGMVASSHNRNSILVELNPQYCELIKERVTAGWQKTKPKAAKKKPVQHQSQSSLFDTFVRLCTSRP